MGTPSPQTPPGLNACTPTPCRAPIQGRGWQAGDRLLPRVRDPKALSAAPTWLWALWTWTSWDPRPQTRRREGQDALPGCSHQNPRECCAAFLLDLGRSPLVDENGNCG